MSHTVKTPLAIVLAGSILVGCRIGHEYERWTPKLTYIDTLFAVVDAEADIATGSLRSLSSELRSRLGSDEKWIALENAPGEEGRQEELSAQKDKFHKLVWKNGPYDIFQRLKIRAVSKRNIRNEEGEGIGGSTPNQGRNLANLTALENSAKLDAMYSDEFKTIKEAKDNSYSRRIGLALSGGGIRSASFAVGILQGLYEIGALEEIGYLSSVSGGGYAASWYTMHRTGHQKRDKKVRQTDEAMFSPGSLHLQHLAQNGHYLVSGHSSDSFVNLLGKAAEHACYLPWYWITNGLFNFDLNVPVFRDVHRKGIQRAFQYDKPCASFPQEYRVGNDTSGKRRPTMRDFIPARDRPLPFWIINMHLALNDDNTSQHRNRSGDAFELTPLRAGSDAVGYVSVPESNCPWWMTPDYGVAISGAAVDSESLKQGFLANLIINTFNTDLGYYVDGWGYGWVQADRSSRRFWSNVEYHATSLNLIAWPLALLKPFSSESPYHLGDRWHNRTQWAKRYLLTDGGHFDNLGVYALVRRGCRLIIISDAASDPAVNSWDSLPNKDRAATFADFRRLEGLLFADFGVEIEMEWETFSVGPNSTFDLDNDGSQPSTVFVGYIKNLPLKTPKGADAPPIVKVIYIKATYDLEFGSRDSNTYIDAEKADQPDFPNERTSNQLYSERKVLAYRQLAREMVLGNDRLILESIDSVKKAYSPDP